MVNIPKSLNNKYLLVEVSGNKYHNLMTRNFNKSFEKKFGRKNISFISLEVNSLNENMFSNPIRFSKCLIKIITRIIKNFFKFHIRKKKYYFNFNPFVLRFKDLREIIKLLKNKNIDNNYSYLNIHIGDLINDSLQRFTWGDLPLFNDISRIFIIISSFIIVKQSEYIASELPNETTLYLAASTSYSNNGIPFRVMGRKKNCVCYSTTSVNHTWLEFLDYSRSPYIDYQQVGDQLQNGQLFNLNNAEKIGSDGLLNRISGRNDSTLPYMKKSSFSVNKSSYNIDFNHASILYLHDLIDTSHHYPGFIFPNMIDYIFFTIKTLIINKRRFLIKLHPNETIGSKIIRRKIFKKLNIIDDLIIPANTSNHRILSSNIKNVISAHGNIIIEAGYYGHFSIGASSGSPAASFRNLLKIPENIKDYEKLLVNNFVDKDKDRIFYESKLAFFLLFHSDLYMNDKDLPYTRKLYKEIRNDMPISEYPLYDFNFLKSNS